MRLPNFLVIGASKGGTTTMHQVLDQHPQVFMCPVKEVGFFWSHGEAVEFHGPGQERLQNRLVDDLDRYQALFEKVTGEKAIGESSVRYISTPRSPKLIHDFIPHAKLVASLRQPADRAYSSYVHNLRDGIEPCSQFSEAVAQELRGERDNWTSCRYLSRGFYSVQIKLYLDYFERAQLHIALFEDLKDNPKTFFRKLYRFLEVDEDFVLDSFHKHNASGIIRNPIFRNLWTHSGRIRAAIRPLMSDRLRHTVTEWFMRDLKKPQFSQELRAELTEHFRQDIEQLQDLIERDLSHWLAPA